MNELLGWYGYGNVDRNDLAKCSRLASSSTNSNMDLSSSSTKTNNQKLTRNNSQTTMNKMSTAPSSRTTNSTPERYTNNSSPESSSRHSPSPTIGKTNLIDKKGLHNFLTKLLIYKRIVYLCVGST